MKNLKEIGNNILIASFIAFEMIWFGFCSNIFRYLEFNEYESLQVEDDASECITSTDGWMMARFCGMR